MAATTTTGTTVPANPLGIAPLPSGSTSANPLSTTSLDAQQVTGVGQLVRQNWGSVTVAQAVNGLASLAKSAQGKGSLAAAAKKQLAQIQAWLYTAGFYGASRPTYGTLDGDKDLLAFRKAMEGAASSGVAAGQYLQNQAGAAQSSGTAGGGTHIIPATKIPEKVWQPEDVLGAINSAVDANGNNLAQKLIGRNFTANEIQGVVDNLNTAQQATNAADVAAALATQNQDIATANATYGQPGGSTVIGQQADVTSGTVTPQQVAQAVAQAGGTVLQQQVAAALVSGPETHGQLNEKNGQGSSASGIFQFLTTTWLGSGGGAYAPTAGGASLNQQATIFVKNSAGNNFRAWSPDLGGDYKNNVATTPRPGSVVANIIASQNIGTTTTPGATPGTPAAGAPVSPVGSGLTQGRTDQGVDFSGKGNLFAVGAGTIEATTAAGWPGGAYIALRLDHPLDPDHAVVYYAEDIKAGVSVGQHVQAGAIIGQANGGSSGIEIGWQTPGKIGQPLAQTTGGYTEGQVTSAGQDFLSYITGATPSGVSGTAAGGAQGQTTDIYQNPVVTPVPADPNATDAATQYAETQLAPQYQGNNLLKMFDVIQNVIGAPGHADNPHILQAPVAMK
jgi:Transglycosylase-like domain